MGDSEEVWTQVATVDCQLSHLGRQCVAGLMSRRRCGRHVCACGRAEGSDVLGINIAPLIVYTAARYGARTTYVGAGEVYCGLWSESRIDVKREFS